MSRLITLVLGVAIGAAVAVFVAARSDVTSGRPAEPGEPAERVGSTEAEEAPGDA